MKDKNRLCKKSEKPSTKFKAKLLNLLISYSYKNCKKLAWLQKRCIWVQHPKCILAFCFSVCAGTIGDMGTDSHQGLANTINPIPISGKVGRGRLVYWKGLSPPSFENLRCPFHPLGDNP